MKIKQSAPDIPKDNPFAIDKLGNRQQQAEILTSFLELIAEPLTISVEAGWGHGKSFFLGMWTQHLTNREFTCITFNAWENDFSEDPLIPFISELRKAILAIQTSDSHLKEISERLREAGIQIAKRALPAAAKLLTAGLLDAEDVVKEAAGDAVEKAIEQKFDDYEANKENLVAFKKTLSDLVDELKKQGKRLPIIFVVDELDRCRPTFAVALLERIKHIFHVDGIIFVLAIDREQLEESVRSIYGSKTDSTRYLRRFIDYAYTLPAPSPEKYPEYLMNTLGLNEQIAKFADQSAPGNFLEVFTVLSTCFNLRLRDIEHAFSIISVMGKTVKSNEYIDPYVLATLVALKVCQRDWYDKLANGQFDIEYLYKNLRSHPRGDKFLNSRRGWTYEALLDVYAGRSEYVSKKAAEIRNDAVSNQQDGVLKMRWEMMKSIYDDYRNEYRNFHKMIDCIEIAQRFRN